MPVIQIQRQDQPDAQDFGAEVSRVPVVGESLFQGDETLLVLSVSQRLNPSMMEAVALVVVRSV